jgi:hypothetical protein
MKAFNKSHPHSRFGLASSFSLTEKLIESDSTRFRASNHDEHNQTGILTSGMNLSPAFPV